MTYLPHTIYLDLDDMAKYILAIPTTGWSWKPVGVTWHNTGVPSLKQWEAYPQAVKDAWGDNLDHYYKMNEGWHAGPHACGTPDKGIILGEFRANGVHASCYNGDHFGIETVGDFRTGGDDPLTGRGLLSMQSSANIIAALCKRMGWDPAKVINFHRSCKRDGHPCPGNLVTDQWALGLVEARLAVLGGAPTPVIAAALDTDDEVFAALKNLGFNAYGSFKDSVKAFQMKRHLYIDGIAGPDTKAQVALALQGK